MVLHGEHEKNLTTTKTMSTTKGVTKFGLNTFHKAVGGGQNGIFANTSVVSVLGMTMLGAKGDTVSQIKASLSDSSTSRDRSVSPMEQGHLDLSNGEDEVDGMVLHSTPGTHMDTVESVGSSGKDVYSSHSGKMHRLSKMKKVCKICCFYRIFMEQLIREEVLSVLKGTYYIPRRKSGIYWIQVRRAAATAVEISLWTR